MEKDKLANFLLKRNKEQSDLFCEEFLIREKYLSLHPTAICALKCMDGRINLSLITGIPRGIIKPFRSMGGRFDYGWPWFGVVLNRWIDKAVNEHRDCVIFVTYHFSKGDEHRGCAGFKYNVAEAKKHNLELIDQFEKAFGKDHQVVYPIQVGIETDEDALIFHGRDTVLDLSKEVDLSEKEAASRLKLVYPDMNERSLLDLVPIVLGNIAHIKWVRDSKRPIAEVVHKENILAVGRGFEWLCLPNRALIVGPYSFRFGEEIETAAKILLGNLEAGRISKEDGVIVVTSSLYSSKASLEYKHAIAKTCSFSKLAMEIVQEKVPELLPYLRKEPLIGVLDRNTWKFLIVDPNTRQPVDCLN